MAFLLDTNILLRVLNRNDGSHIEVVDACSALIDDNELFFALPQNIAEFWNVCTRPKVDNGLGLSINKANKEVDKLANIVTVIPEHVNTHPIWRELVVKHEVKGKQVHDARLVAGMIAQRIDQILTLNKKDFKRFSEITAFTPADILKRNSSR